MNFLNYAGSQRVKISPKVLRREATFLARTVGLDILKRIE